MGTDKKTKIANPSAKNGTAAKPKRRSGGIVLSTLAAGAVAIGAYYSPNVLGFAPQHAGHAVEVATHMGAKIACSARYISGYSEAQIVADLASYSPINNFISLSYDEEAKTVTSSLYGLAPVTAQLYPATGCSLVFPSPTSGGGQSPLFAVRRPLLTPARRPAAEWPVGDSVASSIDSATQRLVESVAADDNANGLQTRALLVVRDGKLVAEYYNNSAHASEVGVNVTATTPLLGWSMAKSVISMLIGRLIQKGALSTDDAALFPEWTADKADPRAAITLEELLQMRSGLAFDEKYIPGADATRMLFSSPSAADYAVQSPMGPAGAGKEFYYSSATTNLLSRLLSRHASASSATATSSSSSSSVQALLDFTAENLFGPLGMHDSVFETDPSGDYVGSSYLYASARDWARLGALMLRRGKGWGGEQLLDEAWVDKATAPSPAENDKGYGYQFWLNAGNEKARWPELPSDAYAMHGNRQQVVMVIPSKNTVIVRLGWTKTDYPIGENFHKLY